ncbi:MAG: hypothetical protein D6707_11755 [Bacteroidetes bacterium]|nr:MAG: hypothetical protein D6707_11755 [Bacteroidota bacterium]
MDPLKNLLPFEREKIAKAPALLAYLSAMKDGYVEPQEKEIAERVTFFSKYSSDPLMKDYFELASKNFDKYYDEIFKYMAAKEYKEKLINEQLEEIRKLIEEKTDKEFQYAWNESMKEFVNILNHEKRNPIEYFLLPLNIPGVTD